MGVPYHQKQARDKLKKTLDQIAAPQQRAVLAEKMSMPEVAQGSIEGIEPLRHEAIRLYREGYK